MSIGVPDVYFGVRSILCSYDDETAPPPYVQVHGSAGPRPSWPFEQRFRHAIDNLAVASPSDIARATLPERSSSAPRALLEHSSSAPRALLERSEEQR